MFNWIIENLQVIITLVALLAVAAGSVYTFIASPRERQIEALKEWLKYAVAWTEKELGSGTGQLKLRMAYDMFIEKFGWLAKFITFETFSEYVDEALEWLNNQLESNKAVAALVNAGSELEAEEYTVTSVIGFDASGECDDEECEEEVIDTTVYLC